MRNKYLIIFIFAVCAFANPANGALTQKAKVRFTKSYGRKYLYLKDICSFYGMKYWKTEKNFKMFSSFSSLLFTLKKREMKINSTSVHLSFAPFIKNGNALISELDFNTALEPILRKASLKKEQLKTIIIDPGHGKKDTGAIGKKYKEKYLNLKISKLLSQILTKAGYTVYMTRNTDKTLSLDDRVKMGQGIKADLFVSIHCNSASASANGIETYAATPLNAPATISNKPRKTKSASNSYDKNSLRLAYEVQKELIKSTKAKDRGVRRAGFLVIRKSARTAILVEAGFLSNKKEETELGKLAYQTKIARSIAIGIVNYHKAILK